MHKILKTLVLIVEPIIGFIVPRPKTQESGCNHGLLCAVGDFVPGNLLDDELIVRHVTVECLHHPVPILPGKRLFLIAFISTGIRVACKIEPVPCPAFAILRHLQHTINQLCPRIRGLIIFKGSDRRLTWWQSDDIVIKPANEGSTIGTRSRFDIVLCECRTNEGVNRIVGL